MSNIYRRGEDSDIAWLPVNIPVYRADGYGMTTGSISPHRTRTRHTGDPHTRGVFHTRAIPYKYFPPPGTPPPLQPQNYTTILYWLGWADMKRDKPRDVVDAVRTRYLTLFNQFAWVPKPHNDRLRKYTLDDSFTMLPATHRSTAPQVIFKPGLVHAFQVGILQTSPGKFI
jgi:hypothetical protein